MAAPRDLALAVALALVVNGCGSEPAEVADPTTTTSTTTTSTTTTRSTTTTPTPTTDDPAAAEGISDLEALAQSLLITVDELAIPTFADAGYTPVAGPNECGVDVDADHPPDAVAGTILRDETRSLQQEIRVFPSAEAAIVGFDARVGAFGCGTGDDGTVYGEPAEVNEPVGADAAFAVTATGPQVEALVVTALVSDAVVSYVFTRPPGEPPPDLPDPLEVAAFGVGKILAALEG